MAVKYWIASTASAFTTATNWSDGIAPASGDTLIFNHLGTGDVTSGLATGIGSAAGGESLTIIIEMGYTGKIGAVASGAATYLTFAADLETLTVHIGQQTGLGSGSGSGRIFIDATNVTAATAYVYDSASSGGETYYSPILLKGAWTLFQGGGNVGVAARPGETATLTAASISPEGNPNVQPKLYLGTGATVTRLDASTGTIHSRSSNTTATLNLDGDADYTYEGTGAHTAVAVDGKSVFTDKGSGNIATLNLSGCYKRRAASAITIGGTALNLYEGAEFDINNGKAGTTTVSNEALVRCGMQDVKIATPVGTFI